MAYTKNLPAEISGYWENVQFCLDSEDLNLYGGKQQNFQLLNVDLYDCTQSESPVPCNQTIPISEILMDFGVLEQTLNVKHKDNPYGYKHR